MEFLGKIGHTYKDRPLKLVNKLNVKLLEGVPVLSNATMAQICQYLWPNGYEDDISEKLEDFIKKEFKRLHCSVLYANNRKFKNNFKGTENREVIIDDKGLIIFTIFKPL